MIDWAAVRALFPALQRVTYLNTATYGQTSVRSVEAAMRHYARRNELACSDFLTWFDDLDAIRSSVARLINCTSDDVAFFPNATSSLSLLAGSLEWREGDRVLTLENEFPNLLYWVESLGSRGVAADTMAWPQFLDAITPATKLVLVSTANYSTGLMPPLEPIAETCRKNGALFYVDATQSLGALPFDCASVQPDMMAVDAYKWLLTPNGAGFAYISPALRSRLIPAQIGWRSDKRWREVNSLHHGAPEFKPSAERYEGGMLPFAEIYAMGASVDLMLELGMQEIEARVTSLGGVLRARLRDLGATLLADTGPEYVSNIIAAQWPHRDAGELANKLKERGILVSARHGRLRVSAHFYNDETDIDRLTAELRPLVT